MRIHLFAALACILILGCGSKDAASGANSPDPTILKPQQDGSLTVTDSSGKQTNQPKSEVTEESLGLPFYPGSAEGGKSLSAVISNPKGGNFIHSDRTTSDSAAKVIAYYEPKLTNARKKSRTVAGMTVKTVAGEIEKGVKVWVSATQSDGKPTQVTIQAKR